MAFLMGGAVLLLNQPEANSNLSATPTEQQSVSPEPPADEPDQQELVVPTPEPEPSRPTATGFPQIKISGHECGRSGTGAYAASARGNSDTSCPFSLNVGKAYRDSGADGDFVTLYVHSPRTGNWYYMDCSGDQPVVCTGGTNAVVYLYGGQAEFTA